MGSSFVIIGSLGIITLGGVTVAGTLGGGTMIGTRVGAIIGNYLGKTVVWVFSVCMVLKIFANLLMDCNWLYLIMKGVCGPGFLITCISYLAYLVACSVADNPGMTRCGGKKSTISTCLSPLVLDVYHV